MPLHLHVDPFSGISGDMFLAALVHLGAPPGPISEAINAVRFSEMKSVGLRFHDVESHGVRGLRLEISIQPAPGASRRRYGEIRKAVAAAPLPSGARRLALDALEAVGRAEAAAHGIDLGEVEFRELGGFDSVVDFVGCALATHSLGVTSVTSNALPLGWGEIRMAQGTLPCPAPATLEILKGLPTAGLDVRMELVTPTGAALARVMTDSFGPPPPMILKAVGAGFGSSEISGRPNCVRLFLGETDALGVTSEFLVLIEANLDDMQPEVLATLIDTCLESGALDAWLSPVIMKKGRPGHVLCALCRHDEAGPVAESVFRHSSTFGIRRTQVERDALERFWEEVQTPWGPVRVKHGRLGEVVVHRAPEFEDCQRLARQAGVPLKHVYAAALTAISRGPWPDGRSKPAPQHGGHGEPGYRQDPV